MENLTELISLAITRGEHEEIRQYIYEGQRKDLNYNNLLKYTQTKYINFILNKYEIQQNEPRIKENTYIK